MKRILLLMLTFVGFNMASCDFLENDLCDDTEADMVLIKNASRDFYIDAYEASRSNAVAGLAGTGVTNACNYVGTKPWTNVTFEDAKYACENAGKRLCTKEEWLMACTAGGEYPYGNTYAEDKCNVSDYIMDTGSKAECKTPAGVYDLSGNVSEWVADGQVAALAGGDHYSVADDLACEYSVKKIEEPDRLPVTPSIGFRCCQDVL